MDIRIDPEFQSLIYSLSDEEATQLEANIIAEGCRDPLVVWKEEQILLDGHHRLRICQSHDLPYQVSELSLPDRYAATVWIINHQLGRRNLTPNQASDLRGRRYNLEKSYVGAPEGNQNAEKQTGQNALFVSDQSDAETASKPSIQPVTAERLATEYGVDERTIRRDGQFAEALDTLTKEVSPTIRQSVTAPPVQPKPQPAPKTSNGTSPTPAPHRPVEPRYRPTKRDVVEIARTVKEQQVILLPFMKQGAWPDYALLEATKLLGGIQKSEHEQINKLLDQPYIPYADAIKVLKNLRTMNEQQRQRIYTLFQSPDERERSLALTMAAQTAPMPDPQVVNASARIRVAEEEVKHFERWQDKSSFEPWSDDLLAIRQKYLSIIDDIRRIQRQAREAHQERINHYAEVS